LAAAALGGTLALRSKPAFAPLLAPVALFATTILLGRPTALPPAIGAAFVAVALGWAAIRHHRTRPIVQHGVRQTTRIGLGVGMLAVAALGASALGPGLPLADAHRRLVLRNYVHPPFDVQQYPSPLAGFRKYTKNGPLYDKTLFTVSGAPDGSPVRIATMTSYDGNVWGTADPGASTASLATFQRVGTSITTTGGGSRATVTVTINSGYGDVWLPTPGQLSKVSFAGPNRTRYTSAFRYNLVTDTGVVPLRLADSDSYTVHALVPPAAPDITRVEPFGTSDISPDLTAFLQSSVAAWTHGVNGTWPQVLAVAKHLREVGKYSDGAGDEAQYLPGHSIGRLTAFLSGRQIVGDDEQYAAMFALMSNVLGVASSARFRSPAASSRARMCTLGWRCTTLTVTGCGSRPASSCRTRRRSRTRSRRSNSRTAPPRWCRRRIRCGRRARSTVPTSSRLGSIGAAATTRRTITAPASSCAPSR
jgi:hypothetical protein